MCSRVMGCCQGEEAALVWRVEEALYRGHYPRAVLPASGCSTAANSTAAGAARCAACRAATRVTLTSSAAMCAPKAATLSESYTVQPLSLHERVCVFILSVLQLVASPGTTVSLPHTTLPPMSPRVQCEFVADIVQSAYDKLLDAFQAAACSCSGCCPADDDAAHPGGRDARLPACLYDSRPEDDWLASLVL